MRVLVTGAGGFVGRGLLAFLASRGHCGLATGRSPPQSLPAGWEAAMRDEILSGTRSAGELDAVIHLEVMHHRVARAVRVKQDFRRVNVEGTQHWLAWAGEQGIDRFLFASSIKAVRPGDGPMAETSPPETIDPYGVSKAVAEQAVREWANAKGGRAAGIMRMAPVYGPGCTANIAAFARHVFAGRPCFIGRGDTRKSVVSRQNASAAFEHLIRHLRCGCEIFNVSDRVTPSVAEFASLVAEEAAAPVPRGLPLPVAKVAATLGDAWTALTGREAVLTSSRLRALVADSVFPADKLVATGFLHPQETRTGVGEWVRSLRAGEEAS